MHLGPQAWVTGWDAERADTLISARRGMSVWPLFPHGRGTTECRPGGGRKKARADCLDYVLCFWLINPASYFLQEVNNFLLADELSCILKNYDWQANSALF